MIREAIELAVNGDAVAVDCVQANDRYFINIAAAGFGAEITAETPVELKNFLGGGAYTLTGLVKALGFLNLMMAPSQLSRAVIKGRSWLGRFVIVVLREEVKSLRQMH